MVVGEALNDGGVVAGLLRVSIVGRHLLLDLGSGRLFHPAQADQERASQNATSVEFFGVQVVGLFAEELGEGSMFEELEVHLGLDVLDGSLAVSLS